MWWEEQGKACEEYGIVDADQVNCVDEKGFMLGVSPKEHVVMRRKDQVKNPQFVMGENTVDGNPVLSQKLDNKLRERRDIKKKRFSYYFREARKNTYMPDRIKKAFEVSGIWPVDISALVIQQKKEIQQWKKSYIESKATHTQKVIKKCVGAIKAAQLDVMEEAEEQERLEKWEKVEAPYRGKWRRCCIIILPAEKAVPYLREELALRSVALKMLLGLEVVGVEASEVRGRMSGSRWVQRWTQIGIELEVADALEQELGMEINPTVSSYLIRGAKGSGGKEKEEEVREEQDFVMLDEHVHPASWLRSGPSELRGLFGWTAGQC
ncbi:hypothetical protein BT69DRAFT_1291902 [Atractiella rhizophila]|nr:hypothetical protein BT69DRAFT_1291902 [Atractiella rhizophila]